MKISDARAPLTRDPIDDVQDDERLLDGENPLTDHSRDAAHWMAIYRELISFKVDLLARLGSDVDGLTPKARHEIVSTDVAALERQLQRYEKRLEYWYSRHWDLHGLALDETSMMATHRQHIVHLTRREFQLLSLFLSYPNRTFAATELAQRAWSDSRLSTDQVRIYVARLRRRLVDLGMPCHLVSQPRRGYCLVCE
jgi:hypothetical protein